ncbi:hypothetical protein C8R47DRAFT_1074221 [Mycena vitilis]|nr:hypothetical protein C8R47DRAFT_1074221 [Mycena vitilis]
MPKLPIDVLESVIDCSAGYPRLLGSLSLVSPALTPRTRVHMFHTVHLGTPDPNSENPWVRGAIVPTRCDAFLGLCVKNPGLALHVRVLVITESMWRRTTGEGWTNRSTSIVPLVRSLHNLAAFAYRTEGRFLRANAVLLKVISLVLQRPKMDSIQLSDICLFRSDPMHTVFHLFADAASLRVLSLADLIVNRLDEGILDLPGYTPLQIDTLAVSFDIRSDREELFIRHALLRACPLLDMEHLRCLRLRVYHSAEDMDRVHCWLSMSSSLEELDIRIGPWNKALHWRDGEGRYSPSRQFECTAGLHMSRLRGVLFRMCDHDGVEKVAAVLQFIALAESLNRVTLHFIGSRGPLAFLDEEAWKQVDDTLARTPTFPLLDRIDILLGKSSHILPDVEGKIKAMMPNTADILRVTASP